ncbi:MAG: tetratricopeptide repeat protein [Meiothermus sp.]|nr:tetratricopeptide repeat protein [Meiothermus sp.]
MAEARLSPTSETAETTESFGVIRSHLAADPEEALRLAQELLDNLRYSLPDHAEVTLLVALAEYELGNLVSAKGHALAALKVWELASFPDQHLETLLLLGRVCRDLSELQEARRYLEKALELSRRIQDLESEAKALNQLAGFLSIQGHLSEALRYLESALERYRQCGNLKGQANVLNNLGVTHRRLGDYPIALEYAFEALRLCKDGDLGVRLELTCLNNIGMVYEETQNYTKAIEHYVQACQQSKLNCLYTVELSSTLNVGFTYLKQQNLAQSQAYFTYSLKLAQQTGSKANTVVALDGLGRVEHQRNNLPAALDHYQSAYALATEIGDSEQQPTLCVQLGHCYLALGKLEEALECAQKSLGLAKSIGQKKTLAEAQWLLADIYEQLCQHQEANRHLREAYKLENELLNQETQQMNRNLAHKFELERVRNEELGRSQSEMVYRLALAAEYRDDNTGEHIQRVGDMAAQIARELGWSKARTDILRQAATLHDIGKIAISDTILLKPGKLTPEEYDVVKTHTTLGAEILGDGRSELLRVAEQIARSHHERWDGKGYPQGLAGEDIPEAGRIVAVADVLDALTSERPYKRAWTLSEAIEEIQKSAGTQFDPRVVAACMRVLSNKVG